MKLEIYSKYNNEKFYFFENIIRKIKVSYFLDIFTFFCYNVEVKKKKGGKANVKNKHKHRGKNNI